MVSWSGRSRRFSRALPSSPLTEPEVEPEVFPPRGDRTLPLPLCPYGVVVPDPRGLRRSDLACDKFGNANGHEHLSSDRFCSTECGEELESNCQAFLQHRRNKDRCCGPAMCQALREVRQPVAQPADLGHCLSVWKHSRGPFMQTTLFLFCYLVFNFLGFKLFSTIC